MTDIGQRLRPASHSADANAAAGLPTRRAIFGIAPGALFASSIALYPVQADAVTTGSGSLAFGESDHVRRYYECARF